MYVGRSSKVHPRPTNSLLCCWSKIWIDVLLSSDHHKFIHTHGLYSPSGRRPKLFANSVKRAWRLSKQAWRLAKLVACVDRVKPLLQFQKRKNEETKFDKKIYTYSYFRISSCSFFCAFFFLSK